MTLDNSQEGGDCRVKLPPPSVVRTHSPVPLCPLEHHLPYVVLPRPVSWPEAKGQKQAREPWDFLLFQRLLYIKPSLPSPGKQAPSNTKMRYKCCSLSKEVFKSFCTAETKNSKSTSTKTLSKNLPLLKQPFEPPTAPPLYPTEANSQALAGKHKGRSRSPAPFSMAN